MASTSAQLDTTSSSISSKGFFKDDDDILGQRIQEMEDDAVPFSSHRGLRFCKRNVLDHPVIKHSLDSSFDWYALGLYRSFGPGREIYTFDSAPDHDMEILITMLWSKGSHVSFWPGTHRHWLDPVEASNSLLAVTRARLQRLGLKPEAVAFEHGGFSIHDSRVAFQITQGTAIAFAFGNRDAMDTWAPMELPRSLESTVCEMEHRQFGMNVRYLDYAASTPGDTEKHTPPDEPRQNP